MARSSKPKIRRLRPQISLRGLLALMVLASVVIVVYRWPWIEVRELANSTRISTTYRRNWAGKPVKDGVELATNSHMTEEHWYEEGEMRRERVFDGDALVRDASYRAGKLHGPFFGVGSESSARGEYREDERHGAWQLDRGDVLVEENLVRNKRQGLRTWKTKAGRLLQSATYDQGRLVEWNGEPVLAELTRWMKANAPDPVIQQQMFDTVHSPDHPQGLSLPYAEVLYFVDPARPHFVVQWDTIFPTTDFSWSGRPVSQNVLEQALANSRTLTFRYGLVNVVPISPAELDWQDRTGVYDVKFEPGSEQERFWLKPTISHPFREGYPADMLRVLFRPEIPCPIVLDTTVIDELEPTFTGPDGSTLPNVPRICRDLVGQRLNTVGYYCEQRGNTLVIKPHADHKMQRRE